MTTFDNSVCDPTRCIITINHIYFHICSLASDTTHPPYIQSLLLTLSLNPLRERCIKKSKKKLTSVSFAFTHTYTLEKLTLLLFFPKRTWKILKNAQNPPKKWGKGGWGCYNSPKWPRYHPIWFKTSTVKENCLSNYCQGKKVKKTNNSAFSATHTYIKLTLVSFFLLFFCTFP